MNDPYLREALNGLEIFIEQTADKLRHLCESPIEVGLLKGFIAVHLLDRRFVIDAMLAPPPPQGSHEARVLIQHQVAGYRLDFAVKLTSGHADKAKVVWIAVECDGHQFHERTKDQARHDKSRDRELAKLGFRILRFTGSEIYRSSFACAADVLLLARSIFDEWDGE